MSGLTQQNEQDSTCALLQSSSGAKVELSNSIVFIAIAILTVLAYAPVLADFFHGDDFVHLKWLNQAVGDPGLLWRNFHTAWLDIPTARFYRPLISFFMMGDYLVWHRSGIGFHLTNVLCHLASTGLLFLILNRLVPSKDNFWKWSSAALFAFYPLHAEAVSWITGRVDTIVTMFFLASFLSYLHWRSNQKAFWLVTACATMLLALFSKEMAIVLPALFYTYALLYETEWPSKHPGRTNFSEYFTSIFKALKPTYPFWLVLAGYIALRTNALGTLVGGYDNSLLPQGGFKVFLRNLLHAGSISLFPFNKELVKSDFLLKGIWAILVLLTTLLAIKAAVTKPAERKCLLFLALWLALSLVPVFKLLCIGDDLQGSRLVYLASAPLSALLCFGFSMISVNKPSGHFLKWIAVLALLGTSWLLLRINNTAWQTAGIQTHAVQQQLNELYKEFNDDRLILLIGLPDTIDGAYVCRNAIDGMTKAPQLSRSVKNCFMLDNFDRSFPFGLARDAMRSFDSKMRILVWDRDNLRFVPASIDSSPATMAHAFSGAELKQLVDAGGDQPKQTQFDWLADGSLKISSSDKKSRPALILAPKGIACFSGESLALEITCSKADAKPENQTVSLYYINDLQKEFHPAYRLDSDLQSGPAQQRLTFPLHSEISWAMGGNCHRLKLLFPAGSECTLRCLSFEPARLSQPSLSLKDSANQFSLGYVQLNPKTPAGQLRFDVSSPPFGTTTGLEVTRVNRFFAIHNSAKTDPNAQVIKTISGKSGTIELNLKDFPQDGMYEARLRRLDSSGGFIGSSSDHVVITVSH